MLGMHPLLERKLRKTGERAFAEVREAKRGHMQKSTGNSVAQQLATSQVNWNLVLSIAPQGEMPFEANVDTWLSYNARPEVGSLLPVLYNSRDPRNVVVDQSEEGQRALADMLSEQRKDARVARMRARGQNETADRYQAVRDVGLLSDYSSDPDVLHEQIEERRAKIKEMMGGTNVLTGGAPTPFGAAGSAAGTTYSLTALTALRDRGVLTEDEFQTQKQTLLAE